MSMTVVGLSADRPHLFRWSTTTHVTRLLPGAVHL